MLVYVNILFTCCECGFISLGLLSILRNLGDTPGIQYYELIVIG